MRENVSVIHTAAAFTGAFISVAIINMGVRIRRIAENRGQRTSRCTVLNRL